MRWARSLRLVLGTALLGCAPPKSSDSVVTSLRPTDPRSAQHFAKDEAVRSFASAGGRFRIHFTQAGVNAVREPDEDANGVPDFAEDVGRAYDAALDSFTGQGFREPLSDAELEDNGGDERFDVYLIHFTAGADGAFRRDRCEGGTCIGHMVQENDFAGRTTSARAQAIEILATHELFHAIQAAYDDSQSAIWGEGTAVWASEAYDSDLRDLEAFSSAYLESTARSLEQTATGPVDSLTYGAGVLFQFLAERYGPALIRQVMEGTVDGARGVADPQWLDVLDATLRREYDSSFEEAYRAHAEWNLFTGSYADSARGYARGDMLAELEPEAIELPYADARTRMLRASVRYYVVVRGERDEVGIELLSPEGRGEATRGLWLFAAPRDRNSYGDIVRGEGSEGSLMVSGEGDEVVFAIVRARDQDEGQGRVPAVCIGAPSELDACHASMASADGGAQETNDGGPVAPNDAGPSVMATSNCSCRVGARTSSRDALGSALVVGFLLMVIGNRRSKR